MAVHSPERSPTDVFSPIEFPCGAKACNRLVKAPMYEHLAEIFGGPPNSYHIALYSLWSRHKWGMVITGNTQVTGSHLSLGRDLVVPDQLDEETLKPYKDLVNAIKGPDHRTIAIMQLSHAGRQSANVIGGRYPFKRPLAPSAVGVGTRTSVGDPIATIVHNVLFQTPKKMSLADINVVKERFVVGARLAYESGFDGVELHAAHGYLLAQFLSPKSNKRKDEFSASSEHGLRLLRQIIDGIRATVSPHFIIGVKLNASDYLINAPNDKHPHPDETRALRHVADLGKWGTVDFIDISGGDYENPEFMSTGPQRNQRQAFFARFSQQAIKVLDSIETKTHPRPVVVLTGGLRTPNLLRSALQSGQADMLGIGRGSVVCPHLPDLMWEYEQGLTADDGNTLFGIEPKLPTPIFLKIWPFAPIWKSLSKVKLVGAGFNMAWYTLMMRRLALAGLGGRIEAHRPTALDHNIGGLWALIRMYVWVLDTKEGMKWTRTFFCLSLAVLGLSGGLAAIFYIHLNIKLACPVLSTSTYVRQDSCVKFY